MQDYLWQLIIKYFANVFTRKILSGHVYIIPLLRLSTSSAPFTVPLVCLRRIRLK